MLLALVPPQSMLFRDGASFHVLGALAALFDGLIEYLIELPLFFLARIGEVLFHGSAPFPVKCSSKCDGCDSAVQAYRKRSMCNRCASEATPEVSSTRGQEGQRRPAGSRQSLGIAYAAAWPGRFRPAAVTQLRRYEIDPSA